MWLYAVNQYYSAGQTLNHIVYRKDSVDVQYVECRHNYNCATYNFGFAGHNTDQPRPINSSSEHNIVTEKKHLGSMHS